MNSVPPVLPAPGAPKRARRKRKIIIFLAVFFVLAGLGAVFFAHRGDPPILVQTEKVARRNLTEIVVANGKIEPVVQVTISPEVSGEIIDLPVKEGEYVTNGELLVKINPDIYIAAVNQAKASYEGELAAEASAQASLEKAQADYDRNEELYQRKLLSKSDFDQFKVTRDMAQAQLESAQDQVDVAKAAVDSAQDSLDKTTIVSPLNGTVSVLNSQLGERVLGTVQNEGTEIMIISDLSKMEARVDVGEMDVVDIKPGQKARLEVDAFKDRKFAGLVTDVASSSKDNNEQPGVSSGNGETQEATKFQVRIRFTQTDAFRPGMSVSAEIETSYRTNALTVPLASVTTRAVEQRPVAKQSSRTNAPALGPGETSKLQDVVFVVHGERVKAVPVKIGICDDNYWEITSGLTNGEEIVSGGYRAISRDLKDGARVKVGPAIAEAK